MISLADKGLLKVTEGQWSEYDDFLKLGDYREGNGAIKQVDRKLWGTWRSPAWLSIGRGIYEDVLDKITTAR